MISAGKPWLERDTGITVGRIEEKATEARAWAKGVTASRTPTMMMESRGTLGDARKVRTGTLTMTT